LESIVFCDITPCSPVKVNDVLEERVASIVRVEVSRARNQVKQAASRLFITGFSLAYSSALFLLNIR
jgi:hypothetical protein